MIRPKTMGDGSVRFQVYGRRNGRQVYVGTADSEREAAKLERKHAATQDMIAAGELPDEIDARRTLDVALDAWLEAIAGKRSADEYSARMRLHVRPTLGSLSLVKLSQERIERLRDQLGGGGELAPGTVNGVIAALSSACTWFRKRKWIAENPCRDVDELEIPPAAFTWIQSREGIAALLAACGENIRTLCAVLVGTGLRLDEALHLTWIDVSLEHRTIAIQRGRKGAPKSGRLRHVPILDSVLPVLRAMKLARGGDGASGMLWPGAKPGRARDKSSVFRPFKRAVLRAKLDPALSPHDLRHTFASHYLAAGGDIFKLSRILGHSSVAVTEKTYAHLRADAHVGDYGRVSFDMPNSAPGAPVKLRVV